MAGHKLEAEPGSYKVTGNSVSATVKRGPSTWAYIYITLALLLAFVWTVIQVWGSCGRMLAVVISTAILIYLFLFNGWFINKLVVLKEWYENQKF
jgi:amino acid permease